MFFALWGRWIFELCYNFKTFKDYLDEYIESLDLLLDFFELNYNYLLNAIVAEEISGL
jgi:hypothetical protein